MSYHSPSRPAPPAAAPLLALAQPKRRRTPEPTCTRLFRWCTTEKSGRPAISTSGTQGWRGTTLEEHFRIGTTRRPKRPAPRRPIARSLLPSTGCSSLEHLLEVESSKPGKQIPQWDFLHRVWKAGEGRKRCGAVESGNRKVVEHVLSGSQPRDFPRIQALLL